ncbi:MAG: hypothetical protein OEZ00_08490 [Dehalococcoidia bacterium]|nr:hypothetical protein [Dehalococcoidia bacterium]
MDLEAIARELKALASKEKLSPAELDRVKYLMVELKRLGISNSKIVELTGGRWSESTVRGYTTGIRSTDPAPWESAAAQLSEMLAKNLTLDNVRQALDITTKLEAMGSSLDEVVSFVKDLKERGTTLSQLSESININAQLQRVGTSPSEIASFIQELKQEKIDTPAFVSLFRNWHKVELTPADAQAAVTYKAQLEDAGFDIEALFEIAEAAGKFGSPREMLRAVAKYGSLGELDEEVKTRREELDKELRTKREEVGTLASEIESRRQELDAAGERLEGLQKETVAVEKALATYRRLEAIGFDEKALQELAKVADKYGGPRKVLTAVNSFGDFSGIKAASEEMQGKLQQQRTTLKELEEKHSHLKSAIEMCQKLLQDHKFGLEAITAILATAKMYGDPIKVLKAVESYGKRKAMDEEARQLEARIEQLKKTESQYQSRNKAILDQFEALNAKAIEVGRTVGSVEEQLKGDTMARDLLLLLHNPSSASYEDSLPLVIVLLRGITIWTLMNKSKFRYPSPIDRNLQEVLGNLAGS